MRCDEVLPALEMGDTVQERAAHNHARACPACAAAIDRWLALKSSLTVAPALTVQECALWRDARRDVSARERLPRMWMVGAAAIAATVVVVLSWPSPAPGPTPMPHIESRAFSTERAEQEFSAFGLQLDHVENELNALSNRIAIADAKRKAAELSDQYRQ